MDVQIIGQKKYWAYHVSDEELSKNIKSCDVFDYDSETETIIAIDIAIKKLFGYDYTFIRDMSIYSYRIGSIYKNDKEYLKNIIVLVSD